MALENKHLHDRIQINRAVMRKLVNGPDLDGRVNVAPEQLHNWGQGLVLGLQKE